MIKRIYVPKGWSKTRKRDELIRRLHAAHCSSGMMKMKSMRLLSDRFGLSEKRVQAIVYRREDIP